MYHFGPRSSGISRTAVLIAAFIASTSWRWFLSAITSPVVIPAWVPTVISAVVVSVALALALRAAPAVVHRVGLLSFHECRHYRYRYRRTGTHNRESQNHTHQCRRCKTTNDVAQRCLTKHNFYSVSILLQCVQAGSPNLLQDHE